jgi:glyoxylase-like metal-dependent hydrolase (beta-lactamase superfamily II)/8-oxo-dGTP pyrophosphatase MutT (NUDIX family)
MSKILDAVTAVLVHDREIYMIRRHQGLPAFPGYHAFPGGKLDPADEHEPPQAAVFAAHEPRLMRAMIREIREEIGLDLEDLAALPARVDLIGRATAPEGPPVRFDTRFFRVELPQRSELVHDPGEVHSGEWGSVQQWMRRYREGEILLAPPTRLVLEALEQDLAVETVAFERDIGNSAVWMLESVCGVRQFFVRSHTLPPAQFTNCFLIGDDGARRVLVDPSPASDELAEALIARVGAIGVDEVFLTHHHPDHWERADRIAQALGVGVAMSADTAARLRARHPQFFSGLRVRIYADGDAVTRWLGRTVRAYAVPGHDEGQLALMPDDRAWCLVGDLIQGVGTVVIAEPEGNMRKYFASLQRVIEWNPRVVIPSHGVAQGGIHFIEQTLRHRRLREEQVLNLHRAGKSIDEMLAMIYAEIDPRLLPLARKNIESHLAKLRDEGALPV